MRLWQTDVQKWKKGRKTSKSPHSFEAMNRLYLINGCSMYIQRAAKYFVFVSIRFSASSTSIRLEDKSHITPFYQNSVFHDKHVARRSLLWIKCQSTVSFIMLCRGVLGSGFLFFLRIRVLCFVRISNHSKWQNTTIEYAHHMLKSSNICMWIVYRVNERILIFDVKWVFNHEKLPDII